MNRRRRAQQSDEEESEDFDYSSDGENEHQQKPTKVSHHLSTLMFEPTRPTNTVTVGPETEVKVGCVTTVAGTKELGKRSKLQHLVHPVLLVTQQTRNHSNRH
jgi:hypothetical protein